MSEWISIGTFVLNLLFIPLLKLLVDIKTSLAELHARIEAHDTRLTRVETTCDRRHT